MSVAREALGGQHRRGRSLSSTNMVKSEKDDDLALFHDMRRKERVNYLHPSADSDEALDSSLSSRYGAASSGFRASTVAQHKHSNDLLVSDPDKSDYDWLLTPPGTPLFPSLEHDASSSSMAPGSLYARYMPPVKASRLSSGRVVEPNPKATNTRGNSSPRRQSISGIVGAATAGGRAKTAVVPASNPGPPFRPSSRPSSPSGRSVSSLRQFLPGDGPDRNSAANGRSSTSSEGGNARPSSSSSNGRPSTPTDSRGRVSSANVKQSAHGDGTARPGSRPSTPGDGSVRSTAAARVSTSSGDVQLRASQIRPSTPEARARPSTPSSRSVCGDDNSEASVSQEGPWTPGGASVTSLNSPSPGPSGPEEGYPSRLPRIAVRPTPTDDSSSKLVTPGGRFSPRDEGSGRAASSETPSPVSVEGPARTSVSSGRPSLTGDSRERTGSRPSTPRSRTLTPASKPSSPVLRSSPPVVTRPSTPTRSLPTRPSTPTRASTPTLQRSSSGPALAASSRTTTSRGGPSPVRASTATKTPSVYAAMADFPSEPPPNLRTTLAEGQPISTRGPRRSSSPAPRGSHTPESETMSRPRGRASSPNMSRSLSDRSSSQTSRGLASSPRDDGTEVNRPSVFGGRSSTDSRKTLAEMEGRIASKMGLQPKRTGRSSSARETSIFGGTFPRKSTDWQHVELRSPMGGYRPVPSNVPALSFFGGGSISAPHRAGSNVESSVATSSNASSTVSVTADTEGSEQDVDELMLEWDKKVSPSRRVEILILDKDEEKSSLWGGSQDDRDDKREISSFDRYEVESNAGSEATTIYGSIDTMSVGVYDPEGRPFELSPYRTPTSVGGHQDSPQLRYNNAQGGNSPQLSGIEYDSAAACEERLRDSNGLKGGGDDKASSMSAESNSFVDIQEDQGAGFRDASGACESGQAASPMDTSSWTHVQGPLTVQQTGSCGENFLSHEAAPLEELQLVKVHPHLNLRNGESERSVKLDLNSTCGSSSTCDTKVSGTGDTDFSSDLQSQDGSLSVDDKYSHDWTDIQVVVPSKGSSLGAKASLPHDRERKVNQNFTSASLTKYADFSPSAFFGRDLYKSTDTGMSTSTSSWEDHPYGADLKYWDSKTSSDSPAMSDDGKIQESIRKQTMSPGKSCGDTAVINKEPVHDDSVVVPIGVLPSSVDTSALVMKGSTTACEPRLPEEKRCADEFVHPTKEALGGAEDSSKTEDVQESDGSKQVVEHVSVPIGVEKSCCSGTTESVQQGSDAAETTTVSGVTADKDTADNFVESSERNGYTAVEDDVKVLSAVVQRLNLLKESQAVRGGGQVLDNDESSSSKSVKSLFSSPDLASPSPGVEGEEGSVPEVVNQDALSLFIDGFEEQFYCETAGNKKAAAGCETPPRRQRSPLRAFQQGDMARSQPQPQKVVTSVQQRNQTGETTQEAAVSAEVAARDMSEDEAATAAAPGSVKREEPEEEEAPGVSERAEVDCVVTPSPTPELPCFTGRSGLEGNSPAVEMTESGRLKGLGRVGSGVAVRRSLTYVDDGTKEEGGVTGVLQEEEKVEQVQPRTAAACPPVGRKAESSAGSMCRCVVL